MSNETVEYAKRLNRARPENILAEGALVVGDEGEQGQQHGPHRTFLPTVLFLFCPLLGVFLLRGLFLFVFVVTLLLDCQRRRRFSGSRQQRRFPVRFTRCRIRHRAHGRRGHCECQGKDHREDEDSWTVPLCSHGTSPPFGSSDLHGVQVEGCKVRALWKGLDRPDRIRQGVTWNLLGTSGVCGKHTHVFRKGQERRCCYFHSLSSFLRT